MRSKGVAWYDVKGSGALRDIFVLLHPPYTAWHLSYVPIGAAMAPVMNWSLLGWTVLAFFMGMGIAGHCLDELNGRPLKTTLPTWLLCGLTGLGLGGAVAIGIIIGATETVWVIPCIVFGGFIVFAYNMELPTKFMKKDFIWCLLPTGFFHRDIWFGVAWGAFPVVTAYVAQAHTLSLEASLLALFALLYSMAQRKLSMQSRFWRRKVSWLNGYYRQIVQENTELQKPITKELITSPYDLSLKLLNGAVVAVAIGLIVMRMM